MARKLKPQSSGEPNAELNTNSLFEPFTEKEVTPKSEQEKIPDAKPQAPPVAEIPRKPVGRPKKEQIPTPEPISIGEDEANALLDLMEPVTAFAARKIYNVDAAIARQSFVFTEFHRRKINPPLVRVMNKWLPGLVKRFSDEIGLAIVLGSVVNAQIKVMHILDYQQKLAERQAAQARVTPGPVPVAPAPAPAQTQATGD